MLTSSFRKNKIVKSLAVGAAAALLLTGCGAADAGDSETGAEPTGEVTTINLASSLPEASGIGQLMRAWADDVEERSGGSLEVIIHPSGALIPGTEIAKGVADGLAQAGFTSSNYHINEMPVWNIVGVPFVSDNGVATTNAFQELYAENGVFRKGFDDMGLMVTTFIPVGNATAGFSDSLETVDGLNGQRVRTAGTMAEVIALTGADTIYLELVEVYEAGQRGVVDGFAGVDFATATSFKFGEVLPNFVNFGIGQYSSGAIVMNPSFYQGLAEEQRQAIDGASDGFIEKMAAIITPTEAQACEDLKAQGGDAFMFSNAEVQKFKDLAQKPIAEQIRQAAIGLGVAAEDYDAAFEAYGDLIASYPNASGFEDGFNACSAN